MAVLGVARTEGIARRAGTIVKLTKPRQTRAGFCLNLNIFSAAGCFVTALVGSFSGGWLIFFLLHIWNFLCLIK